MAARSASKGTPVKILQYDACNDEGNFLLFAQRSAPMRRVAGRVLGNLLSIELRSTDSSTMRIETGKREIFADAGFLQRGQESRTCPFAGAGRERVERIEQAVGHGGISWNKFVSLRRGRAAAR